MKLMLVAPPLCLNIVTTMHASMHLVEASHLDNYDYRTFYLSAHNKGDFILMDNGAAESGRPLSADELAAHAKAIHADEVCLPDWIGDSAATVMGAKSALAVIPKWQRAVCPHGKDWNEWEYCATQLVALGVATICIGRYDDLPGGRLPGLRIIHDNHWDWDHNIHLFGCSEPPINATREEVKVAPWVRSMDTGAPFAYAQENRTFDSGPHASLRWDIGCTSRMAERNIDLLRDACIPS